MTAASYKRSWWPVSTVTLDPAFGEIMCLPASAIQGVANTGQKHIAFAIQSKSKTTAWLYAQWGQYQPSSLLPLQVLRHWDCQQACPQRDQAGSTNSQLDSPPLPPAPERQCSVDIYPRGGAGKSTTPLVGGEPFLFLSWYELAQRQWATSFAGECSPGSDPNESATVVALLRMLHAQRGGTKEFCTSRCEGFAFSK